MEYNFFIYLQRLELIAFFSGYPLIYAIIQLVARKGITKKLDGAVLKALLPYGYALVATLYLGLQLKNFYPDYSFENVKQDFQFNPFLISWAILAILFWIPALAKKPLLSLVHSFVFFFLLLKDIFVASRTGDEDYSLIRNDMKLHTTSLLINLGAQVFVWVVFIISRKRKDKPGISI